MAQSCAAAAWAEPREVAVGAREWIEAVWGESRARSQLCAQSQLCARSQWWLGGG
ncbi:hypothetical protein Acsp05_53110 [Actinokineospora sp. NBRC 105648]|nr:hypothetical protein Acsp05_53110 [Actinokineospora sp. NBRC 105648]